MSKVPCQYSPPSTCQHSVCADRAERTALLADRQAAHAAREKAEALAEAHRADLEHEQLGHRDAVRQWNEARADVERLKDVLGEIAALGDFCEECEPRDATVATHLTTHVHHGLPIFLCAEHAEDARRSHCRAESKGCGKQPEVVEHEQDVAVTLALAALAVKP